MSSTAIRRIQKELTELLNEPLPNITVLPDEENLFLWKVIILGPSKTPYAGGKFVLNVTFAAEFPFKPPKILFQTKMYHPNIDSDGNICMAILKSEAWKPSTKMSAILFGIYDLLQTPNPDDPLVTSIAEQYQSDRKAFEKKAAEYTAKRQKKELEFNPPMIF